MMGKCIYIASILILFCITTSAQDNLTNKYKTILPDNVWVVYKNCEGDSCYNIKDTTIYYYLDTAPFNRYKYDSIVYTRFVLNHIAYYIEPISGELKAMYMSCAPQIGIPNDSTLKPYYWSEGYLGHTDFIIYEDSTFSLTTLSLDSTIFTNYYKAVTPPEEVRALVERDRLDR